MIVQIMKAFPAVYKWHFPSRQKHSRRPKNIFERAHTRVKLEFSNFHDLRDEGISRVFETGWNVMKVAAGSRHEDLQSLKRYTNLKTTDLAKQQYID
ncbi:tyrosine-type recombinase/integrase [Sneathiella aquimaris]|uniref:tyrosine-type recombinase/integrase n=1 Tax=Sneathiella aquimaris TaxID=2599305 RepID=UPI00146ED0B1|nr:tyrosine-type recombinase/integrase [Sneathiella aquimaris]